MIRSLSEASPEPSGQIEYVLRAGNVVSKELTMETGNVTLTSSPCASTTIGVGHLLGTHSKSRQLAVHVMPGEWPDQQGDH
jgi:hypothetical protein